MSDVASQAQEAGDQAPSEPKRLSPRVKLILRGLLLLIVLAVAAWLVYYELIGKYHQSTNDAYIAADMVVVSPRVGGYVEEVYVADNQDVKAGQPLVRIDARDYQAQADQFKAQADVAAANADNVRASIAEQEASIAEAKSQLAAAESQARTDAAEVARYTPLAQSGAETTEKLASLRNQAARSKADVDARRAAVLAAQRRVDTLKAQIRQAQAQGEVAQAQIDSAKVNLASTVVRAGVDGRVGDRSVQVGQFVQPGTRIMSIVPLSAIYIEANFKETQIGRMRQGQPVSISVDALPGTTLKGHVDSIAPGTGAQFSLLPPQNATGNFTKIVQRVPVRIAIEADDDARRVLVPGLSVTVDVDTDAAPAAAQDQDGKTR